MSSRPPLADKADPETLLARARTTFDIEAEAVLGLKSRIGPSFVEAVHKILGVRGRVVVMGMGKSGHVGRKIAATLASTGTPAMFVHPAEASHGDLGMIKAVDLVLAISNSGESDELAAILPVVKRQGVPLIAITGGRYVNVDIDRFAASRYGLNVEDVQTVVSGAIGGENIGEVVDGRARYPINLRYPREVRDTLDRLIALPIVTEEGLRLTLGEVARVVIADGPSMIRSENGRLSAFVYVDVRGRDLASVVGDLQRAVAQQQLPAGVSVAYSGQFEYLERAAERLTIVGPATLAIIFLLLYATFRRFDEAAIVMASLPFALTGGIWLVYLLGYDFSVAVAVGFIALAGLAAEFGVVMLIYLKNALKERADRGETITPEVVAEAVREGALLRLRPKAMTVAVILAGLFPILWTGGAGAEVMRRIAAPLVGGMLSAPLLSLFVIPAAYLMIRRSELKRAAPDAALSPIALQRGD